MINDKIFILGWSNPLNLVIWGFFGMDAGAFEAAVIRIHQNLKSPYLSGRGEVVHPFCWGESIDSPDGY